ncbi:MAG TPA: carboxypeptidase-like regulatory domain-containing protein, partial [Candidatus Aminicenantes bacterium]|nr:carboxypeptidase-like regulatory domain-containing protein [Candidatus Aminicenantes bacterium]
MQRNRKHMWAALLAVVLLIVGISLPARGQSILTGKISGTITDDAGEALPGVNVEVTSPALISGKRATVSTARGSFVFLDLPPGEYKITASLENFKTIVQEGIMVSAGSSLVVNLALPTGNINETVEVVGAAPIVDSKSSTIDSKIQAEMLTKLPTSRDAFYDLSLTTPGMFDHGSSGGWMPSPTAYGGASNENVFLVNGVNATNPRGASFGALVRVNYNAVEEVRVVAL